MTRYVALLRAVNVGGTGKLPMAELKAMAVDAGFTDMRTYIASGNLVLASADPPASVKKALEKRLRAHAGKPVTVIVRTAAEMQDVLANNPFSDKEPKYTLVTFLDTPPPADALDHAIGRADEEIHLGEREITIHYASGVGRSKLRLPAAEAGTARNINTVTKLVEMVTED
ncbi:MAG: DUF1697 domain-containing protein [Hyphomicrobiales bacterium]|nr:DUF1697 domain-containing protein [Hyphomicrobiales bacterium]